MTEPWARTIQPSGQPGPDYWNYYAQRLVELATIPKGAAVLDLGTYDGNVLFKAMKIAGSRGFGVGIDIDNDGLKEGLIESRKHGSGKVDFAQMEAASLGFPPESFHCVLSNFIGWDHCFDFDHMEFIAPDRRVIEILRVLKPGGQVGIGSWVEQGDIDWMAEAFRRYLPEYMKAIWKGVSSYSKENPEGYQVVLRSDGFHNIRVQSETTTVVSPDTETWWQQMKLAAREYFEQVPDPAKLEGFKEQVITDLQQFRGTEGIYFSKTVTFIFGTKL